MNLDPQTLQQILALRNRQGVGSGGGTMWYDPNLTTDDPNGYILHNYDGMRQLSGGDAEQWVADPSLDQNFITKLRPDTGGKQGDQWDTQGNYLGTIDLNSGGGGDLNQAIALMAAGYFGGGYMNGADAAASGAAAGSGGIDASVASMAAGGGGGSVGSLGSIPATAGGIDASVAAMAAGGGGGSIGSLGSIPAAAGSGGGAAAAGGLAKAAGGGLNWGSLLGAAVGAMDGKDQQATTSRDPWAPAQPALRGLLSQGEALMNRPAVSDRMQSAYDRQAGLLDYAAQIAPTLMAQQQANASGANNYSRLGGRRGLLGG